MVEKQNILKSSNIFTKGSSKYTAKDQIIGTLYWCQSKLAEDFFPEEYILFFNIRLLSNLWEFCIIYSDHTPFPVLPCPPTPVLWPAPTPWIKRKKKKSNFYYLYTHWTMVKFSVAYTLNRTESFLFYTSTRSHQLWRVTLQHPWHTF